MLAAAITAAGVLAAVAAHEGGHFGAARALGYPAKIVRYGLGAEWGSDEVRSPAVHRLLVTAAGPFASVAFGVACWQAGAEGVGLLSLALGVLNLIPVRGSDGHSILKGGRDA